MCPCARAQGRSQLLWDMLPVLPGTRSLLRQLPALQDRLARPRAGPELPLLLSVPTCYRFGLPILWEVAGSPLSPCAGVSTPCQLSLSASRARCRKHPSLIKTKAACLRMAPEGTVPSPQRQAGSCPSLVASGQSPFRAVEHRQAEVRRRHQARPEHPAWRPRKCQAPLSLQTEMWIPSRVRRHWDEEGDCSLLPSSEEAGQPTEIC